jgi:flagellar basal-body rod protein FlgB
VLAANIANASTPGYRARDVVPFQKTLSDYTSLAPRETQSGHMAGTITAGSVPVASDPQTVRSINGNSVLLDEQMTEVSAVGSDQSLVTSIWKKYATMLSEALGR